MPIMRAMADRIGELRREIQSLKSDRNEDREYIAELKGQLATWMTAKIEDGRKIRDLEGEVRGLKRQGGEIEGGRPKRVFQK